MSTPPADHHATGMAGRIARTFVDSKLTPLIVISSLLLGLFSVAMLPREAPSCRWRSSAA